MKVFLLLSIILCTGTAVATDHPDAERYIINQLLDGKPPPGVLFAVREYDEDALVWVLPRVEEYIDEIRSNHPEITIAMMSHGDELVSLSKSNAATYQSMHTLLRKLVLENKLHFHICGTMAKMNGLGLDDFPEYVDVVPFGPAQVEDYLRLGYVLVDLELTW